MIEAEAGSRKVDGKIKQRIMNNTEKFDYKKAMEELEAIAAKVEDPQTGIDDIDKYMKRSQELIAQCREYLRGARNVILSDAGVQ